MEYDMSVAAFSRERSSRPIRRFVSRPTGRMATVCLVVALSAVYMTQAPTASAAGQSVRGDLVADARDLGRQRQAMKADIEQKRAEQLRKFEQKKRDMKLDRDRLRAQGQQNFARAREEMRAASQPLPFDLASAPRPDKWVQSYIATAKSGSIERLLQFLPQSRQKALISDQANYDPEAAAERRESLRQRRPHLNERSLEHLTNSPYAGALKFHKEIADNILEVLSFSIEGNKAYVSVSTTSGGTINSVHYRSGRRKSVWLVRATSGGWKRTRTLLLIISIRRSLSSFGMTDRDSSNGR